MACSGPITDSCIGCDDDTPTFKPNIREEELLSFFWRNFWNLKSEYDKRKQYDKSVFIIDVRLDQENIDRAKPVYYGNGHFKDEEYAKRQPLDAMAFRYQGLGIYILPKECPKNFGAFREHVLLLTSEVLKKPLNDFHFRHLILVDNTTTCKTILNEIKRLSKEHQFYCENLAENKDLSVKSLKPFDPLKYDGTYNNPNNIPNIVLVVTVKPYEITICDQSNDDDLDTPADAFLLGILASRRPVRTDRYFGDASDEDDGASYFFIQYFLVDEKHRSKGFGSFIIRSLLNYLTSLFPKKDEMICEVQASPYAKEFWETLGFCALQNRRNDEDVITMSKRVEKPPSAIETYIATQYRQLARILGCTGLNSPQTNAENNVEDCVRNTMRTLNDSAEKYNAVPFRDIIKNCKEGGSLYLRAKTLTSADVLVVVELGLLQKRVCLLDLSFNPGIESKGLLLLIDKIRENTSLTDLILVASGIDNRIALQVANKLNSTHIRRLDLANNEIGDQGAIALMTSLWSSHSSLLYLSLANNRITDEFIHSIDIKLHDATVSNKKICLRGNLFTQNGQERLIKIVATKYTGLEIDV
ncbi:hypothetical protein I4U23_016238 [Adineta vaga]|nr:hypothetical protein I4U23_016238 [Adineta vaga]